MTSARKRSLLTDYSKFKADIGSAAAKTRPSQPCHNHRSSSNGSSEMDVVVPPSVKCGPAVISPCNGPVNGNRTSLEKLEEEMQRIMVQVALEQQSGHDYTVTTMCTDDYEDDGSSSETTMESLEDPVLEESLKSHHGNKQGSNIHQQNDECATSTKEKMEMSDPSLSAHDLFDMDSDDDDDEDDSDDEEGEMNDNSLTRPIRTHGHQSMPMLGLQDFSPVLAPPCPTPRRLSNQYQKHTTTTSTNHHYHGMNESAPAVASSVRRRMGGNNNSNASLTDYMETYDEEHRREKSYLRGTGCATEDLRQELSQIVLPTRRRQKTLPKRSKTWDEKLKNAVATQESCASQLSVSRHGGASVPRATLRKSRSVDAQTARGMLTIPIPRPRNNSNRNEPWHPKISKSNGGSLNSLSSSTHSRARNDNILLQIANRGGQGIPQQPKPKPSPAATTTWTRNGRSTIRKSKSIGGEASTMPVMAAPPVRRFRRHRKSDNNDNNNPLQHLHNSTGQLLYDYHSDVLGSSSNNNTTKGSSRMMPPKSKSLGSGGSSSVTTPDTTGAVLSSKKGSSKKTKKYVATNNNHGSNNSSSCFNSSFNNSFVTGSRITKGAPSWL